MQLDIVTPKGALLSATVDEVVAPGAMGEFGVLPRHVPFLAGMKAGVLRYKQGATVESVAVGPGYVEVAPGDRVVVLASVGIKAASIRAAEVQAELKDLEKKLAAATDRQGREDLASQVAWAKARLAAVGVTATTHPAH